MNSSRSVQNQSPHSETQNQGRGAPLSLPVHSINPKSSIRNPKSAIRNPVAQSSPESSSTPECQNPKPKIQTRISRLRSLHSNQHGAISILTVFILLMFTMLLMMVFNVAKQQDDKLRMQNAADAAAYSGGVVLARGMNAIAFGNHLEAEVFAITAILREANMSEPNLAATVFLPSFEAILGTPETLDPYGGEFDRLIPLFQRDIVVRFPHLAQVATDEISLRLGLRQAALESLPFQMVDHRHYLAGIRRPQSVVLWQSSLTRPTEFDTGYNANERTLPVIDPDPSSPLNDYWTVAGSDARLAQAQAERRKLADWYLQIWLERLDRDGSLSEGARQKLHVLLNEQFPTTNLPLMLNEAATHEDFTFVGVVYRRHVDLLAPRMFRNQLEDTSDAQTFAQVELYIPRARYLYINGEWDFDPDGPGGPLPRVPHSDNWSHEWSTFNQNWMIRLVPATSDAVPAILAASPGHLANGMRPAPLLDGDTIRRVNTH